MMNFFKKKEEKKSDFEIVDDEEEGSYMYHIYLLSSFLCYRYFIIYLNIQKVHLLKVYKSISPGLLCMLKALMSNCNERFQTICFKVNTSSIKTCVTVM